ncbi:GTP-binding protein [Aliivibrio finisterrensis]|uniref:GTP-binding protein n=1 Tax=Aliivibrio finisterrensis TaxID=511998 RepID=A0A4Q5KJR3_9GAMM|nr:MULTISPECIES: GTPase [Aliivibrio]MDD9173994.1 50S ribosome-binding GTPase [Aliivibrio sp. S3TY1]MDD9191071.1 50S ribosome-binding GTPase [Aliivibrio sp. S2TY2]RYU46486.1 GTP-binding protein [Aliivibrio finisterrensis]
MHKIKRLYRLLSDLSGGRWGIVIISSVLPVIIMMCFALFFAVKYGHLLELSITIAISTLAVSIPLFILSRTADKPVKAVTEETKIEIKEGLVKASEEWSHNEVAIWKQSQHYSRELLKDNVEWGNLDEIGLDVLEFVATKFDKKALDFSIPEGLKLFEEISQRYKVVVQEHIPGIEYLKLSYIKAGYDAYDKYGDVGQKIVKAAIWANHAKNLYYNPLKVVSDLSREQAISSMTRGVVSDMQQTAKEALLDEVAAVAIDLYSGRFSLEEGDLQASKISKQDEKRVATELEPIRIVMVGQTSSGKSSIINTLKEEFVAEVDVLPSTDNVTVYSALVNEAEVNVVDLQGLDGNEKTEKQMLKEMTQADLVLWVLKANQSARDLDKQLNEKFERYYADPKNISRKKPTVISVVNQVDRLNPAWEWEPPYDLEQPTAAKAKVIKQAMEYNKKLLCSDLVLPLSISIDKTHFGVEELKQTLVDKITEAYNVQRNRQRKEAMERGASLKKQLGRAVNVGKKVAPSALKAAAPKLAEMAIKKTIK